MPADENLHVRPADLLTHATHLDAIAGTVTTAEQAGTEVWLDPAAYGRLCTIVPVLLESLQGYLVSGIGSAVGSLRDTGDRLRTAALDYQATDSLSATDIRQALPGA